MTEDAERQSPPERGVTAAAGDVAWPEWMRLLGRQARRIRELLGLSQDEIARRAGVSQGAVSRLETGRGLATPLLVVLKVDKAMRDAMAGVDPERLTEEARRWLRLGVEYVPSGFGVRIGDAPLLKDPGVEQLLVAYNRLPERQRPKLLAVVQATVEALSGVPEDPADGSS